MAQVATMNQAQLQILDMLSFIKTPEALRDLNKVISDYFVQMADAELYDENMLHGLLISEVKDYEECIQLTDSFLPFVDNWAVCDIMSPKVFAKHKKELLAKIKTWSKSSHVYTCRHYGKT